MLAERIEAADHPALRAWSACGGPSAGSVELLGEARVNWRKSPSAAFRLTSAEPGSESVIAKWTRIEDARVERMVYEEVLPLLPVARPRFLGAIEDRDGRAWLLLEDVGDHVPDGEEFVEARTRWLVAVHATPLPGRVATRLPPTGPVRYRDQVAAARRYLRIGLANGSATPSDRAVIEETLRALDRVERSWSRFEADCAPLPSALVHGDLVPKNVRGGNGRGLYVLDWETAGYGPPAPDLVRERTDLALYRELLRRRGMKISATALGRASRAGGIFRLLAAVEWASRSLAYPDVERSIRDLRIYGDLLRASLG